MKVADTPEKSSHPHNKPNRKGKKETKVDKLGFHVGMQFKDG